MARLRERGDAPTGHLVWLLAMRWRSAIDAELASAGLSHATYVYLSSLRALEDEGSETTQSRLAASTGMEPMYVSRLSQQLEGAGLIERHPHAADARSRVLVLTPAARDRLDHSTPLVHRLMARLTSSLGPDDERDFRRHLTDLIDATTSPHRRRQRSTTKGEP